MKEKERKNFAKKIAKAELAMRNATDLEEKGRLEVEIMSLCSKVKNFEDLAAIDELVQEILNENF